MTFVATLSLAFSGWMAWTLHESLRAEKPSGWQDWLSTVWIASGSLAGVAVAVSALLQAAL